MNLKTLLKGTRLIKDQQGKVVVQTLKNMQIVGLTADPEYSIDKFGNPFGITATNRQYGSLRLANHTDRPIIVPAQIAAMSKKRAQNHGMVKAAYVPSNVEGTYNDAGCVQGSQTGYLDGTQTEYKMMPIIMREELFEQVNKTSGHSNIYGAIDKLGKVTKSNAGSYIDVYYNKYGVKTKEFIAHFERFENLIGIMVLVNNEIVAIDKFPSFQYAQAVWEPLIRDCYGVLPIIAELENQEGADKFTQISTKTKKKSSESPGDYLQRVLDKTKDKISSELQERLEEVIDMELRDTADTSINGVDSHVLKNEAYIGQVISEGSYFHLVSLVKRATFNPAVLRDARKMKKLADTQDDFEL